MTSPKQIEANRRNALKSTGPRTEEGKRRSRRNAIRHGLTAETVITDLEDPADYKAFEAAVTADYDAQTAVERELVLRLASLLWRLRRALSIERGLFEAESSFADRQRSNARPDRCCSVLLNVARDIPSADCHDDRMRHGHETSAVWTQDSLEERNDLTRRFMRLAEFQSGVFDRLNRYETALWRQVGQTLFVLGALTPRSRHGRTWNSSHVHTGRLAW